MAQKVKNLPAMQETHVALVVKNLLAGVGDVRDTGSVTGSGGSSGEGYGNPLQYSCLESPRDRGTWRFTVHGISKSLARLKQLSAQTPTHTLLLLDIQVISGFFFLIVTND